jgi:hypothetical protein
MGQQEQSKCNTLGVPIITAPSQRSATNDGQNPILIYTAAKTPLRLLVRNISANGLGILISYDRAVLELGESIAPAGSYTLPAGTSDVFPLMPNESLYAVSPNAVPGLLSYAVSVAFPFDVKP